MDILIHLPRHNYSLTITRRYCGAIMYYKGGGGRDCADGKLRHWPRVLWDIITCELNIGRWKRQPHLPARQSGTTSERT